MSAAIDNIIAALTAEAAKIVNTIDRLECLVLIEEYAAAKVAESSSSSTDVSSYTMNGRSVSYRSLAQLNARVAELRSGIDSYIRNGSGAVVDNRLYMSSL
jgi:hypothetical protein